jgi:formate dehydrogenase iron-sulfur subunit
MSGNSIPTVYIPRDTTALSLGSDKVARSIQQMADENNLPLHIVRNGSRGLYWLEPMIEVETERGRIAYGPVTEEAVENFMAGECWLENENHPLYLGPTEEIPYLKNQQRLTFSRVGIIDPLSVDNYCALDGFAGLRIALQDSAQQIVTTVTDSGLRGRGGAAFPTGIKWQTVLNTPAEQKYVVCNADEGDSGTYADRMIMESDPFCLIEGMTIAGLAVGATQGYIYLREEYRLAEKILNEAIAIAAERNYLGNNILGSGKAFTVEVRLGAGAYICGEETALLESLEGKRGMVRAKPPLPAIKGLWQQPTVINNVISLASVPIILSRGADYYKNFGMGRSRGTVPFQLAGNIKQAGLVELAFGPSLNTLLQDFGGGTRTGKPMKAVQVGGPLGAYLPASQWDTELDYEAFTDIDAVLGHGGIVAFDDAVDMGEQARFSMEFCAVESCGKCTPCRIGSTRGVEVIDKIRKGDSAEANTELLKDLCETMVHGSLCAMGGMTPFPVMSALKYFPEDFNSSGPSSSNGT